MMIMMIMSTRVGTENIADTHIIPPKRLNFLEPPYIYYRNSRTVRYSTRGMVFHRWVDLWTQSQLQFLTRQVFVADLSQRHKPCRAHQQSSSARCHVSLHRRRHHTGWWGCRRQWLAHLWSQSLAQCHHNALHTEIIFRDSAGKNLGQKRHNRETVVLPFLG